MTPLEVVPGSRNNSRTSVLEVVPGLLCTWGPRTHRTTFVLHQGLVAQRVKSLRPPCGTHLPCWGLIRRHRAQWNVSPVSGCSGHWVANDAGRPVSSRARNYFPLPAKLVQIVDVLVVTPSQMIQQFFALWAPVGSTREESIVTCQGVQLIAVASTKTPRRRGLQTGIPRRRILVSRLPPV